MGLDLKTADELEEFVVKWLRDRRRYHGEVFSCPVEWIMMELGHQNGIVESSYQGVAAEVDFSCLEYIGLNDLVKEGVCLGETLHELNSGGDEYGVFYQLVWDFQQVFKLEGMNRLDKAFGKARIYRKPCWDDAGHHEPVLIGEVGVYIFPDLKIRVVDMRLKDTANNIKREWERVWVDWFVKRLF